MVTQKVELTEKDYALLVAWRDFFLENGEQGWTPTMSLLPSGPGCMIQQLADLVYANRSLMEMFTEETSGVIRAVGRLCEDYVGCWNDAPGRTYQDCVDLLNNAIEYYAPKESNDNVLREESLPVGV